MTCIRVVLAGMPPMLRDIVHDAVAKQPDIDLVADLGEGEALFRSLKQASIDVVIVGARQPDDFAFAGQLLQASSRTKVLVVADSGRSASMYELRPHRVFLGDVSAEALVTAIRAGMEDPERQAPDALDGGVRAGRGKWVQGQ